MRKRILKPKSNPLYSPKLEDPMCADVNAARLKYRRDAGVIMYEVMSSHLEQNAPMTLLSR